jgi:very-short-patch-repair endonuclease/transcription elongation GreA/GreB family factor
LSTPGSAAEDALRVRQIFRYLAEAGESRAKPVRTHDGARHQLWFAELPAGVSSFVDAASSDGEPVWLRVERLVRQEPPLPDGLLRPWIDPAVIRKADEAEPPPLREQADIPEEEHDAGGVRLGTRTTRLAEYPLRDEVRYAYLDWSARWSRWADKDREIAPAAKLYECLYRIHEDAVALGESYELVLGCGYLTWSAGDEPVRRHLVTARAVLTLDQRTGTLSLGPDPESGNLLLEEGMLDAGQKARSETREAILARLEDAGDLITAAQIESLHDALTTWVISTHEAGRYQAGVAQHRSAVLAAPTVSFAPALLLRERNRRTMLDVLHRIAGQIEQGAEPTELLRFIAGGNGDGLADSEVVIDGERPSGLPEETYFALPSNDEQRTIAERMRDHRLVVVQGPPGTGKTHTIANLVTDLLAHGQRVLITSHTARALKVLKNKLPSGVRELCVSRTDDGIAAQQELEGSIRAILDRQGSYSPRDYQRRISHYEDRLRAARGAQALALKELRILREQETYRHPADIGDYQGTLQQIAQRLADERETLSWLGTVPAPEPLLTSRQIIVLRHASAAYSLAHRALSATVSALPEAAVLPGPASFEQAVEAIRAAEEGHSRIRGNATVGQLDSAVEQLSASEQDRLTAAVEAYDGAHAVTASLRASWVSALRGEVLAGNDWTLRSRLDRTNSALTAAESAEREFGSALVTGLDRFDLGTALGHATTLHAGLQAGEKLRGPLGMKTKLRKAVGEFVDAVRVDGRAPEDVAGAAAVLGRVRLERHLHEVESEWGEATEPWQSPARRLVRLRQDAEILRSLAVLSDRRGELLHSVSTVPALMAAAWENPATLNAVRDLLRARAALRTAESHRSLLETAADALRTWSDRPGSNAPVLRRGYQAIAEGDIEGWAAVCDELTELREALRLKSERDSAYTVVHATLPALAAAIDAAPDDPCWDARLPKLEAAWAWSAWTDRMRELSDPAAENTQRHRLAEADGDIRITLDKLAADRAWHGCLGRLTNSQAVALTSYQQSVRRLGKGTGKYAARYRSQARESLRECQDAVPAWIMPLYQVTETVPTDVAGRFDVVIIDEASQSGPEALLLAWLGAKIVVVGDDKQVSPANVGLDQDQLFQLQSRLLGGLPASRRNLFGPTASFFDIASGLAGGTGRLMLREHFRCMPEIIGFSNELCYDGRLQPLRQYGADRLQPLRAVHVPDGFVEGTGQKQINRAEAERLVDEVARCCADPAYQGRTMGVITLLGAAQKHLIEDLLAERLSLTVRQDRHLRVGDAEDFQGDERDVMFISLVVSLASAQGERRPGAFNGTMYQQRINVAASRARDQVWVFHSVSVTELGENDFRRRYLDYLSRPAQEQDGLGLDDVTPDGRHEAFDSLFEQRVFLALRHRGYRVRPQYPAGRYRIDLVVEGGTKRLAVECDGDAFHNEENADADAARQRELERVGWTFVRIRGSRFFLDPDAALKPLWAELDRLGIESTSSTRRPLPALPTDGPISRHLESPKPATPAPPRRRPISVAPAERPPTPATSAPSGSVPGPSAKPKVPELQEAAAGHEEVPKGFQPVGWIRKQEADAAQLAFSRREDVLVTGPDRIEGLARHLSGGGIPGLPGADVVEVTRKGRTVARLLHVEVQTLIRASIARVEIPVMIGDERIGTVQYFAPYSAEAQSSGSTLRLLRIQVWAETTAPRGTSGPKPRTTVPARDMRFPIDRLSINAYRRVQGELDSVLDALSQPAPQIIAVDASSRTSQLESARKRRQHLEERRDYLRRLMADVEPDPRHSGGHRVTPGCLIGVEYEDDIGITVYEITALRAATSEHESLTPDSALGKALLWREVGDEVTYQTDSGSRLMVTIRYIED